MLLKCIKANKQVLCKANDVYLYLSPNTDIQRVLPQLFEKKTIKTQVVNHVGRVVDMVCEKTTTHKANYATLKNVLEAVENKQAFSVALIGVEGIVNLASVTL